MVLTAFSHGRQQYAERVVPSTETRPEYGRELLF
jgi:hypothetical protein